MDNKQLTLIVFTTILVCGILFMICTWVRFNRLETKSLELESDVYVLKLVQQELLDQHGLTLQVGYRGELARRLGKEDMDQQPPSITFGSDDDDEEEEEPPKKKRNKKKGNK
jgi:hypothetical protein